jgi:hypothetical protein
MSLVTNTLQYGARYVRRQIVGHFYEVVISKQLNEPSNKWTQLVSQRIPDGSTDFLEIQEPPQSSMPLKGDK